MSPSGGTFLLLGGSRAARPKPAPVQGSKAREKRSMTMRHLYWQEKRRVPQMRHSPVSGAGLWGFRASSTHFPHRCLDFSIRFPADHAGFCAWFLAGVCNDFGGVWGLTTARRPVCDLFFRKILVLAAHLPPKKNGLFPFTSQWNTLFLRQKTKKNTRFPKKSGVFSGCGGRI